MGFMTDYLKWRGDLTFAQSPFCEADNLILSCLAYVNLDGIAHNSSECITVKDASDAFFSLHTEEKLKHDRSFIKAAPYLLRDMAETARFQNLFIRHYENRIDTSLELQFSAMEIPVEDNTSFIAYRGTDDTLVGWKEDFNMSFANVPAEAAAVDYLNRVGSLTDRPLRISGHSKGGHLAVYAASLCREDVQNQITEVYSNDGPGFSGLFCESPGFKKIQARIKKYVPEFSIFGMLLQGSISPVIIKSSNKGISQHDAFSWEIEGPSFVRAKKLNGHARIITSSISDWLKEMDARQREDFIIDLFSVVEASGAETITQLQECGIKGLTAMAKKLESLNPETRSKLDSLLKIIWSQWTDSIRSTNPLSSNIAALTSKK